MEPSQEGGVDTVGLGGDQPIGPAPCWIAETGMNSASFEARKGSHLRMTAADDGAHTAPHRRVIIVSPSTIASNIGDASTA